MPNPLPQDLQKKFVDTLLRVPGMEDPSVRYTLTQSLPPISWPRNQNLARADLNGLINAVVQLGRLNKGTGARPLIVVANTALESVPDSSDVAQDLHEVNRGLEQYYGGDTQPVPDLPAERPEALLFGVDTWLPFDFVAGATRMGRSVARLMVPRVFNGVEPTKGELGTGWLIAPGVLMTAYHVIARTDEEGAISDTDLAAQVSRTTVWFDYQQETDHPPDYRLAGLLAANKDLDYAVLELADPAAVADRPSVPLVAAQPKLLRGSRLNIAQHPNGGPLRYAIRNNFYVQPGVKANRMLYQTDTKPGSSGSPVCDDSWKVVGLHRASTPIANPAQVPQEVVNNPAVAVKLLNEAVEIHTILADLPPAVQQRIRAAQNPA